MASLTSFYSTTITAPWAASLIPDTGQRGGGGVEMAELISWIGSFSGEDSNRYISVIQATEL